MKRVFSGSPWEKKVGYCRVLVAGNIVSVSGTTAIGKDGKSISSGDAYEQAYTCLQIISDSLAQANLDMSCITRTRMYVTDISLWEKFAKAHHQFFEKNPPTTTMVEVSRLIAPEMLIEIEAEGIIPT